MSAISVPINLELAESSTLRNFLFSVISDVDFGGLHKDFLASDFVFASPVSSRHCHFGDYCVFVISTGKAKSFSLGHCISELGELCFLFADGKVYGLSELKSSRIFLCGKLCLLARF